MNGNEEKLKKFPTMKSQGAAKNEANNAAQAGSAASAENVEVAAPAGDNNGFFTPNEKIDFSKVTIEPLFEEQVDFDTFSKSDFRAVKVKACEAVKKSKKLLQFTLDVNRYRPYHPFWNPCILRAGRTGW